MLYVCESPRTEPLRSEKTSLLGWF